MTDWDKKDRKMAWMNTLTNTTNFCGVLVEMGIWKPKNLKDGFDTLNEYHTLLYQSFLGNFPPEISDLPKEEPKQTTDVDKNRICERCHRQGRSTNITEGIADFSMKKYGEQLCMDCQKHVRQKES